MAYQAPDGTTYTSRDSYERARDLGYTRPTIRPSRQPQTTSTPQQYTAPDGRTYPNRESYERAEAIRQAEREDPQPQTSSPQATEVDTQQAAEEARVRELLQQYGSQAVQEKYEVELKRPEGAARPVFIPEGTYDEEKTYGGPVYEYPTEAEGMSKEEVAAAVSQRIPGVIEESYQQQEQARRQWEADLALGMAASSPGVRQKAYEAGIIGVEDAPPRTFMEGVRSELTPTEIVKDVGTGYVLGFGFTGVSAIPGIGKPIAAIGTAALATFYGISTYAEYKATPPQQQDYFIGKESTEFAKYLIGGGPGARGAGKLISRKGWGKAKLTPESYNIKMTTEPGGYGKPRKFKIDLTTNFKEIAQPVTTTAGGIVQVKPVPGRPGVTISASEITKAVTIGEAGSVKPLRVGDVGLSVGFETGFAFPSSQVGFGGTIGRRGLVGQLYPTRTGLIKPKTPRDTAVTAETMMIETGGQQFVLGKGLADYPGRLGGAQLFIPRMGFTGKGYGKGIIDRPAPQPLAKITEISTESFNVGKIPEPTTRREDIMRGITERAVQKAPWAPILFDAFPTRGRPSFQFDKLKSPLETYTPSVAAKINLTPIIAAQRAQAAYKFKIKPLQKYATASALGTAQLMGQKAATTQSFQFDSMFDQRSKLDIKTLTKTRLQTDTMTRTRTRTRARTRARTRTRTRARIGFPEFSKKGSSLGIGRRKGYKRGYTVFASPSAVLFNIRATRKQRRQTKFTGLEVIGLR